MSTQPPPPPLNITILGAGIAGLTTALALSRHNHKITLLERSTFPTETGAAMYISPNCSGHLFRLGWDPTSSGAITCEGVLSIWGQTGEVRNKMSFEGTREMWRSPWLLVHRVDLHEALKGLVMERGVKLELGVNVTEIDPDAGTVSLEDGRVFEGNVIIGADGNNSFARKSVDEEARLRIWGKSCYRFLVERSVLKGDEETRGLMEEDGYFLDVLANDRKFVVYPCRGNREMNFACFLPEGGMQGSGDGELRYKGLSGVIVADLWCRLGATGE